jgi:hypothetical protein
MPRHPLSDLSLPGTFARNNLGEKSHGRETF